MDIPVSTEKLIAKKEGAIGWVIFNNPEKRNAMSLEMSQATAAAMESYAKDSDVRVVILRGAGDKAFVSGADISQFKERRGTLEQVRAAKRSRSAPTRRSANARSR
jgi:enoyl-CoA hydratase